MDPRLQESLKEKHTQVKEAIASINKAKNERMKTSGKFKFSMAASNAIDIFTCKDQSTLISIMGFILQKEEEHHKGAVILELVEYPVFTWCGYTPEAWRDDIKVRMSVMFSEDKLNQLKEAERNLASYFSEEIRLAAVIENVNKLL